MNAKEVVTESSGVVRVDGKVEYNVMLCQKCGACVTITIEQRLDGTDWLYYLDKMLDCCFSPNYYYSDHDKVYLKLDKKGEL